MLRTRTTAAIASVLLAFNLAACGDTSDSEETAGDVRTVEFDMVEVAFEPDRLEVNEGDTIRFVFTNRGEIAHDAFIGDADAQAEHESDMRADDDAEHERGHEDTDEEEAVTVAPGDSEEITHTFDEAGATEIGCHQEGHYDAGMTITVEVT